MQIELTIPEAAAVRTALKEMILGEDAKIGVWNQAGGDERLIEDSKERVRLLNGVLARMPAE